MHELHELFDFVPERDLLKSFRCWNLLLASRRQVVSQQLLLDL
jgi:hypothetical protein